MTSCAASPAPPTTRSTSLEQAVQVAAQLRGGRQDLLLPPGRERRGDPGARQRRRLPGQPRRRGRLGVRHHRPAGPPALAAPGSPGHEDRASLERRLRLRRMNRGALIERDARAAPGSTPRSTRALEGHGSLVLLAGEAGVGKTRLAEEVLDPPTPTSCAARRARARSPTGRSSARCAGSCVRSRAALVELRSAALASRAAAAGARRRGRRRATARRCSRRPLRAGRGRGRAAGGRAARRPPVVRRRHARAARRARRAAARAADARGRRLPLGRDPARASAPAAAQRPAPQPPAARAGARAADRARAPRELAERVLGAAPSPRLAGTLYDRTGGIPFFVEELAGALARGGRLRPGDAGVELALDADVPLPQTIRDAVLLRPATCRTPARATAEAASVAGHPLRPRARGRAGLARRASTSCSPCGLIVEVEPGRAAFRHPLARDAIYEDVPWLRRRALHRGLAVALEARGGGHARGRRPLAGGARRSPRARLAVRAVDELRRGPRLSGRRRGSGARRSTCGRRGSAAPSGSRCSSATRGSRSSRASSPRRAARSARWWPRGAPRAPAARSPTPSAGSPRSTTLQGDRERALAARARRGGRLRRQRHPRRGRRGAADRRGLPVERRPPRRRGRAHRAGPRRRPGARSGSTCGRGSSGSRASSASRAGSSRRGWRPSGPGSRSRSSTSSRSRRRRSTSGSAPRTRWPATTAARATRSTPRSASARRTAPTASSTRA